MNDVALSIAV